jgi:hypothetical protein
MSHHQDEVDGDHDAATPTTHVVRVQHINCNNTSILVRTTGYMKHLVKKDIAGQKWLHGTSSERRIRTYHAVLLRV